MKEKEMLKIFSLFSGIGAFEEGLKNLEITYDLMGYSEIDDYASRAYSLMHNVDEELNYGDINKIDEKELPDFDLMTYGFPCQSFSVAGKRLGFEDVERGNLFFESMRIANYKKPKYLIAENVKGLVNHDKGETFKTVLETLEEIGYNNYWEILNSKDYGVPQHRERVFIVSIRKDIDNGGFKFPSPFISNEDSVLNILDKDTDIDTIKRKNIKNSLVKYNNKVYFLKNYKSNNNIVKLFDGCDEGYFNSSFTSNRIFSVNGISPTLTTKNDAVYHEINGHLNSRERFALQGFNKKYVNTLLKNNIPKGEIDKMSGNSITVNVVQAILETLLKSYFDY